MLKADFKVAYNTALFFYLLFNNSILSLKDYLAGIAEKPEKLDQALIDFSKIMDGFIMPKWCKNLRVSV
jgi:hypothetical protein